MGERGKPEIRPMPAAEGAIHPETLRQKDRLCTKTLESGAAERHPPMGQRQRLGPDANLSGIKDRGVNSYEFALFFAFNQRER